MVMVVTGGELWQWLAALLSGMTMWAQHRAKRDPLEDLTERLRRPVLWALRHPWRAVRRVRR